MPISLPKRRGHRRERAQIYEDAQEDAEDNSVESSASQIQHPLHDYQTVRPSVERQLSMETRPLAELDGSGNNTRSTYETQLPYRTRSDAQQLEKSPPVADVKNALPSSIKTTEQSWGSVPLSTLSSWLRSPEGLPMRGTAIVEPQGADQSPISDLPVDRRIASKASPTMIHGERYSPAHARRLAAYQASKARQQDRASVKSSTRGTSHLQENQSPTSKACPAADDYLPNGFEGHDSVNFTGDEDGLEIVEAYLGSRRGDLSSPRDGAFL
ncbi:MAG: hypothetical protein M1826_000527 [Phylliscum demangeonii]|nr:MAG: hypothetical protein M1826_000527 [Phylliscum demangeonii]